MRCCCWGVIESELRQAIKTLARIHKATLIGLQKRLVPGQQVSPFTTDHAERGDLQIVGFEENLERVDLPFGGALPFLRTADRTPAGAGKQGGKQHDAADQGVTAPIQALATGQTDEEIHAGGFLTPTRATRFAYRKV